MPKFPGVARATVSTALVGLVLTACGDGPSSGEAGGAEPQCADFEPTQPASLDASVRVVATGQEPIRGLTALTPALIADESGLYWYDRRGFVFAQQRGQAGAVQLLAGLSKAEEVEQQAARRPFVVGMVASDERLYVGDGYLVTNPIDFMGISDVHAPGRLLSIPKQGGPATVLLESEDQLLVPLAVDGERIIVSGVGDEIQYYQVSLSNPRLEPLPVQAPFTLASLRAGALYWPENGTLLRSAFDAIEPEAVAPSSTNDLRVGPGYFLYRDVFGSLETVVHTLYIQDAASGCSRTLPRLALVTEQDFALDSEHFYYYSSAPLDWSLPGGPVYQWELVRADVRTGALVRIQTPEMTPQNDVAILGHDAESIYVNNGGSLVAIQKPR